jgi:predicted nucleotidyltransferase
MPPVFRAVDLLLGQTRRSVLALFFTRPSESFYLRQIWRLVGGGLGAVQREVNNLARVGLLRRTTRGKQILYQSETNNPIFPEIKSLIDKTVGIVGVIREALMPLASRIQIAFIYGSTARQEERVNSDVDLMIVGDATFSDVVFSLERAQTSLTRDINPTVFPVHEFQSKLARANHFLTSVLGEKKLFVIGDEHELAKLAAKRLGHSAQKQQGRNRRAAPRRRT